MCTNDSLFPLSQSCVPGPNCWLNEASPPSGKAMRSWCKTWTRPTASTPPHRTTSSPSAIWPGPPSLCMSLIVTSSPSALWIPQSPAYACNVCAIICSLRSPKPPWPTTRQLNKPLKRKRPLNLLHQNQFRLRLPKRRASQALQIH